MWILWIFPKWVIHLQWIASGILIVRNNFLQWELAERGNKKSWELSDGETPWDTETIWCRIENPLPCTSTFVLSLIFSICACSTKLILGQNVYRWTDLPSCYWEVGASLSSESALALNDRTYLEFQIDRSCYRPYCCYNLMPSPHMPAEKWIFKSCLKAKGI